MRLSLLIPAIAVLALAACDAPSRPKTATVNVPVQNANCTSVPLTCPPATAAATLPAKAAAPAKTIRIKARHHGAVVRRVAVKQADRAYGRPDVTAEGLLPPHPLPYVAEGQAPAMHRAYSYTRREEEFRDGYYAERGDRERGHAYDERRGTGGYSEGRESYSERRVYRDDGCNCHGRLPPPPESAGRDRYGFLTWPGKVPARP